MTSPTPGLDTQRPFTRAHAIACGLDPGQLRSARFRRILRGVYVDASVPATPELTALAALALHPPSAYLSHCTAAVLRGLPVPPCALCHVSVVHQTHRVQVSGISNHVAERGAATRVVRGLRLSDPLDLFVELAGSLGLVDLVVLGDAIVRRRLASVAELTAYCASTRRRHARAARVAAAYVRAEVDSPMETRLRMLLVLAGLPEPVVNHTIVDSSGRVLRRFDLSYPEARLIVEYDGRQHAETDAQWLSDISRREELDEAGWRLIVVTSKGIYRDPATTIARVVDALRNRGLRIRRPTDAWRAHFPAR